MNAFILQPFDNLGELGVFSLYIHENFEHINLLFIQGIVRKAIQYLPLEKFIEVLTHQIGNFWRDHECTFQCSYFDIKLLLKE